MKIKYAALFVLVCFTARCGAQESIMQGLSTSYVDTLVAVAKENYPRVKMLNARVNYAKTDVTKTKISYLDVFTFSYLYSPNNTVTLINQTANPSLLNGYQLGMYMNIGTLIEKPSMVKEAKEQLRAVEYEKETSDLNLEAQVKERYYLYLQQLAILKLRAQTLLDSKSMLEDIKTKYERGEQTFDEYNKILIAYAEQNQEKIITETAVLTAKSNLEELLGKKLEEIK